MGLPGAKGITGDIGVGYIEELADLKSEVRKLKKTLAELQNSVTRIIKISSMNANNDDP